MKYRINSVITSAEKELRSYIDGTLKAIDIPEGVTYIKEGAFTVGTLDTIKIPNSLTEVAENSFGYNTREVYIPSVEKLCTIIWNDTPFSYIYGSEQEYRKLFIDNKLVTDFIIVPETITEIGKNTFCALDTFGSNIAVRLPKTITKICTGSFSRSKNSLNPVIFYDGTIAEWRAIQKENNWINRDIKVSCSDGTVGEWAYDY